MSPQADRQKTAREEQRVALPFDPEDTLRVLLAVEPDALPVDEPDDAPSPIWQRSQRATGWVSTAGVNVRWLARSCANDR